MKKLLCTFCSYDDIKLAVDSIIKSYELPYEKIYVFRNLNKDNSVLLSYNVSSFSDFIPNTISINRNSRTKTLYTINAMNKIIIDELGELDKTFIIDWRLYRNKLLTTDSNDELIISDLEFIRVIHLNNIFNS